MAKRFVILLIKTCLMQDQKREIKGILQFRYLSFDFITTQFAFARCESEKEKAKPPLLVLSKMGVSEREEYSRCGI